ncbi:hypothetical protein JTB14_020196 [Gonioctena quinquepunctata]|nr:hypothetical protein JTB14_020196 [Gonioctena quinquepunctata]
MSQTPVAQPAALPPQPSAPAPQAQSAMQAPPPVQAPVAQPPVALVPILSDPELKLQFGRLMSRRRIVRLDVNPGGLTRVITRVYQTMVRSLGGVLDAPIEQAPFLQMIRTLILKRLQDLVEGATGIRPENPIRIARTLPVPQPIGELLYALGTYYAQWNGIRYELRPSPTPAPPEPWRQLDPQIVANYRQFMDMTTTRYRQCPFPKMSDLIGQPLMFCCKNEADNQCQILAPGPVPTPADAFLRFVHEEFFAAPPFAVANCQLVVKRWNNIRDQWLRWKNRDKNSKKSGAAASKLRKYLYHEQLNLGLYHRSTDSSMAYKHTDEGESQQQTEELQSDQGTATPDATKQTSQTPSTKIPTVKTTSMQQSTRKRKRTPDGIELRMLKSNEAGDQEDRHMQFFKGILPPVQKFTDNQIVDFQMGVLQVIKNIQNTVSIPTTQPQQLQIYPPPYSQQHTHNSTPATIHCGTFSNIPLLTFHTLHCYPGSPVNIIKRFHRVAALDAKRDKAAPRQHPTEYIDAPQPEKIAWQQKKGPERELPRGQGQEPAREHSNYGRQESFQGQHDATTRTVGLPPPSFTPHSHNQAESLSRENNSNYNNNSIGELFERVDTIGQLIDIPRMIRGYDKLIAQLRNTPEHRRQEAAAFLFLNISF